MKCVQCIDKNTDIFQSNTFFYQQHEGQQIIYIYIYIYIYKMMSIWDSSDSPLKSMFAKTGQTEQLNIHHLKK